MTVAKMKVAYLVRRFPVLSQTFIMSEILDHLDADLDVRVISIRGAGDSDWQGYLDPRLEDRITYLDIPSTAAAQWKIVAAALVSGRLQVRDVIRIGRTGKAGELKWKLHTAAVAARMARIMDHIDVLHCHFGDIGRTGAAAIRNKHPRLIVTFHGYDVTRRRFQPLREYYSHLLKRGDLLLAVNRIWRDRLVQAGCDPMKAVVHHMGVETAGLAKASSVKHEAPFQVKLVLVGRMVEKKGHRIALEAIAKLHACRPELDIRAEFVGDGPLRSDIEHRVGQMGLADRIRISGACSHAETLEKIAQADALLLPSLPASDGDMEGIPVVLMEAMAIGRPVISTRHSGIPELVEHGVSGLLAEEGNADELADAIALVAGDPKVRIRLAANARRKVSEGFDLKMQGRSLRSLYAEPARPG